MWYRERCLPTRGLSNTVRIWKSDSKCRTRLVMCENGWGWMKLKEEEEEREHARRTWGGIRWEVAYEVLRTELREGITIEGGRNNLWKLHCIDRHCVHGHIPSYRAGTACRPLPQRQASHCVWYCASGAFPFGGTDIEQGPGMDGCFQVASLEGRDFQIAPVCPQRRSIRLLLLQQLLKKHHQPPDRVGCWLSEWAKVPFPEQPAANPRRHWRKPSSGRSPR